MWVEVAYALPDRQKIIQVDVPEGTTLWEAVKLSAIESLFPDLKLDDAKMGIFGKLVKDPKSVAVKEGDRVEIYRPLLIDPKQARINRAKKHS